MPYDMRGGFVAVCRWARGRKMTEKSQKSKILEKGGLKSKNPGIGATQSQKDGGTKERLLNEK